MWLSENQNVWGNGKYFNQTANIDASVTQFIDEGRGFSPIGIYNLDAFQGNYNGQGYTIDGLYINRTEHDYNALFGSLNSSAIIQNLGLTNADISGKGVAALVGCVYSSYVTINNCYATGSVTSIDGYTGGLVAYLAYGTMSNCYSNVAVLGLSYSGALVGRIRGEKLIIAIHWEVLVKHPNRQVLVMWEVSLGLSMLLRWSAIATQLPV